jgi:hypothetical protein
MMRRAFIDQGIIVAKLDDPRLDDFGRQYLKNLASKILAAK